MNTTILTRAHSVAAAKKRARKDQVKEVLFDDDARREFLTGFHKRKVRRQEDARKKAVQREKDGRKEARIEKRRLLAERAAENAAQVELAYGAHAGAGEDEEWAGVTEAGGKGKGKATEAEYEDEEQLATVTVVEEFDPDELIHGPPPGEASVPPPPPPPPPRPASSRPAAKSKTTSSREKKKKAGKVKYQTKAARAVDRGKQRARRTEKAERAGGKAARRRR